MKVLKIVAIVLGTLAVLAALAVGLALVPSVQTWAVKKAVAGQPGMKLDVARVAAGLSSAEIEDLHLVKDGAVVTAKRLHATYSAWDFISHKRITVHDLGIEDLLVDARAVKPAESPAASSSAKDSQKPFHGIISDELPFELHLERFTVPGRLLLPGEQTATFELHGSDLIAGKRGTIDWKVDLTNGQPAANWHALHVNGTAGIHLTTDRRIDLAEIGATAAAEGPQLPSDRIQLKAKIEQPAAGGNEGYDASLSLVRGTAVEQLMSLAGQCDTAKGEISGAWKIAARSEQLAALLTGLGLPDAAITGSGSFTLKPDTNEAAAKGEIDADIARLEKISPHLATIGRLHVTSRFDGGFANNLVRLAQFNLEATAANGRKLAAISTLQNIGFSLADKRVTLADAKADLARIAIQSLPLAWAQPFLQPLLVDSGELNLTLAVAAESDGSRVRLSAPEPLTVKNVTIRDGEKKLLDQVSLSVRPQAEYAADTIHAELNELTITAPAGDRVAGKATADIARASAADRSIAFSSELVTNVVAALKPYLPVETGPLTVTSTSRGTMQGNRVELIQATSEIKRASGPLVAAFELLQPLAIDLNSKTISPAKSDRETARLRLGEIPLPWAEPFVADSKLTGQTAGGTVTVTLRSVDDITATTTEPVVVRGISATLSGQPMLRDVDLVADFTAAKNHDDIKYEVKRVEARQGTVLLTTFAAAGSLQLGEKLTVAAKGNLEADAAAVLRQPVAATAPAQLASGRVTATFDASIAETVQAKAKISLRGFVAKQNNQPLGDADLDVTAAVQSDGSSAINVPFTLTNANRRSDILLEGKLSRAPAGVSFNGRVTSKQLFVDDLQAFAALAPSSSPTPAAATRPPASTGKPPAQPAPQAGGSNRDTAPFWGQTTGKVELAFDQIIYGKDYLISGVHGTATISPTQLALNPFEGKLKANPFLLNATITFDANQDQPYTLAGKTNVSDFDVGEFLRAGKPNEAPKFEGVVSVVSDLSSRGTSLTNLLRNTHGSFEVTGRQGMLRALAQKSGTAVSLGATALQLLGGGGSKGQQISAVAELAKKLAALPFDQFKMHVERGADLKFKIGHIEFVTPDTHILGRGESIGQTESSLSDQKFQLTLSLAGKDSMAVLLNEAHALSDQKDELGFNVMKKTFTWSGSANDSDSSNLWKTLGELALQNLPGNLSLPNLFGR